MLRSAVLAVLAAALSSSVAAAQTFVSEAETLFALGAGLAQQTPIEKLDFAVADHFIELTPPAAMVKADARKDSLFHSAVSAVAAVKGAISYHVEVRAKRPVSLRPLYGVQAAVQALDLLSTWRGLDSGRSREINPLFKGGNRTLMAGVKLGTTSANVYLLEKLRKKHPVTALALLIGANAVVSGVAINNLRIGS